jgi:hypothetical protein
MHFILRTVSGITVFDVRDYDLCDSFLDSVTGIVNLLCKFKVGDSGDELSY